MPAAVRFLLSLLMSFLAWTLPVACGSAGAASAQAPMRTLFLDHGREDLRGHVSVLIDATKSLKFRDVSDAAHRRDFTHLDSDLNAGLLDATVWLRFEVQRAPRRGQEWWLEVQPNTIERAVLYVPDFDGNYSAYVSGSAIPFSQRDLRYRNPMFKLHVWSTRPQVFYLKVKTRGSVAPRLTLWQPAEFLDAVGREQTAFGLYLGVYAMLVLASFWFERALRDGVYRSFGVYVFCCMLLMLGDTGLLFQYAFPEHPLWARTAFGLIIAFSLYACVDFLFRFLDMPRRYPRLTRRYLGAVGIFSLLVAAGVLIAGYVETIRVLSVALTFFVAPLTFALLVKPALDSVQEVRYAFLITGVLMFVGLMVQFLLRLGYIERNWITEYSAVIASLVFFLIIYYAISRRYYAMRAAKDAAQKKLLEISHRTEMQLEQQVAARTEDLQQAMATVEHALAQERAAYEEQRQFIATVSHELRTPLAVIDATAQNLTRDVGQASAKALMRLEKIRQASERLSSLFDIYLSSNRLDVLSRGTAPTDVSLLPLLEDAIAAAQPLADRHRFILEQEGMPSRIWSDPDLLRLVLRTLADNAVKYTPSGSTVRLRAAMQEDGWRIEIADDGPGIPEDEQGLIFERFFRGRAASGNPGSGLGLALARRLVEMLGGTLILDTQIRQGATFRIWLPDPSRVSEA
ncbi:sensor histidine kinase [Herbaspirillum sp. RV1423]|uniref:sensor histidine kinase n=1 Tax=Herbaspirillum sp. RV1423 TaxID=1443993 RepID=UPI0004B2160F|nr:sensor histidine kinase [Herbaspirillum sp. RV1423]